MSIGSCAQGHEPHFGVGRNPDPLRADVEMLGRDIAAAEPSVATSTTSTESSGASPAPGLAAAAWPHGEDPGSEVSVVLVISIAQSRPDHTPTAIAPRRQRLTLLLSG